MVKTISDKFEEPNDKNVEPGDFVVNMPDMREITIYPITKKDDHEVFYMKCNELASVQYDYAIILKRDGKGYLIGRNVRKEGLSEEQGSLSE